MAQIQWGKKSALILQELLSSYFAFSRSPVTGMEGHGGRKQDVGLGLECYICHFH